MDLLVELAVLFPVQMTVQLRDDDMECDLRAGTAHSVMRLNGQGLENFDSHCIVPATIALCLSLAGEYPEKALALHSIMEG